MKETVTDYEVETEEIEREITYCDWCGREAEGAETVPLVANPGMVADSDTMDTSKHHFTPPRPRTRVEYERALEMAIDRNNHHIEGLLISEDICAGCLEELADGEPRRIRIDNHSDTDITSGDIANGDSDSDSGSESHDRSAVRKGFCVILATGIATVASATGESAWLVVGIWLFSYIFTAWISN